MKKGIVLMMTLGFIAVITALILWSVSISKNRFDKVVEIDAENQFQLIFNDFTKMVTQFDINSSDKLQLFLAMDFPALVESESKIGIGFHPKSLMDKLNINYILGTLVDHETNTSKASQDPFLRRPLEKFFAQYELSDRDTMIDFLLDTIDKDDMDRGSETEIVTQNFDFRQGKIYDYEHFKKIMKRYYQGTEDENIFKITKEDFKEVFYFGEPNERLGLDCESLYIAKSMGLIVEGEMLITEETDFCAEAKNQSMSTLNKIYNIAPFAKKKKYLIECTIDLDTEDSHRGISFEYDVSTKRISNIDKNIQKQE